ncbi:dihydrofolate reductase [Salmonella phage SPLA11]|nr:dihydrofolate reductase [Salmonella phage SPLA11]
MINIIFAMGQNWEFGLSPEFMKHQVDSCKTMEEVRALPKSGLPWECPSDMLFFRTMTNSIASEPGYNAYQQLLGQFPSDQLRNMIADVMAKMVWHSVLLAGRKTFMTMSLPMSYNRILLPVSRQIMASEGYNNLGDMAANIESRGTDVWIVGGAELILSALEEHAKDLLRIDNMFISTIKQSGPSDILMDRSKLMMYIDSDFTYNDEYVDNKQVLIQRYRSLHK